MPTLRLITAEDFLASREENPPWIMRPFLMRGSSLMLYGRQGIGKSSLVIQLAYSFISGKPWLGFPIDETGPVIYLPFDMAVEETRRLIERAESEGMDFRGQLYIPVPEQNGGDQIAPFDIYKQEKELEDLVRQIQPVAVILDTADDGYEAPKHKSVTEVAREVVKMYRRACGRAAFVFIRHQRKKPAWKGEKEEEDDPDAFSGPKEWEAVASSSLQFLYTPKSAPYYRLKVRKTRIDKSPVQEIGLSRTKQGFFEPLNVHVQLLSYWPGCVPPQERAELLARVQSMNDVFRDVAERTGSTFEAVKKAYQRACDQGVEFPWPGLLRKKEEVGTGGEV
jgi:LmbE family N-acetylglucosaminyl deacetylase